MINIASKIREFFSDIMQRKDFLYKAGIKPAYLFFFVFLALGAVVFEGISVALLSPTLKGLIEADFQFVRENSIVSRIASIFPHLFSAPNSSIFIFLVLTIFLAIILKNALFYFSAIGIAYHVRKYSSSLKKLIMARYMTFGKLFFDKASLGYHNDIIMKFTDETSRRLQALYESVKYMFLLVVYFALMVKISWRVTLFVIAVPPLLYCLILYIVKKTKRTSKFFANSRIRLSETTFNILSCLPLIKSYNSEAKAKKVFAYESDRVAAFSFSMDKKMNITFPVQEIFIAAFSLLLISIMAYLAIKKQIGHISGYLIYFYLLKRVSLFLKALSLHKVAIAQTEGPLRQILKIFNDKNKYFIGEGKEIFTGLKKNIEFNHLNFSYDPERKILKDITFSIEKGKITAIVGPTGSGKTTIINLLLRFYDCNSSEIKIDGVDIRKFAIKSLRDHIALVSQDTLILNDTIKANMVFGLDNVTDEQLVNAAKKAQLYEFITDLPKGFETRVGDRGIKLSGGERQRLSIARIFLKGAEILMLDEATSSLDTKTENLIQRTINVAIMDRTAIVIAHRLSTVKSAHKIIVIENGRLIEEGPLDGLLKKKGKFCEYWKAQKFY